MKRFNFDDDFEQVYLRETGLTQLTITAEHENVLRSQEVQKIIGYTANYHWGHNPNYWLNLSMEKEDLCAVSNVYALYYIAKYLNTSEYDHKHMMKFIGQRIEYCGKCFYRKYSLSEVVFENSGENAAVDYSEVANEVLDTSHPAIGKRMNKKDINFFKNKISENLNDYKDMLAYYAVSKHVHVELRKKARKYCKTYGINYREIATSKYLGKGFDFHYVLD